MISGWLSGEVHEHDDWIIFLEDGDIPEKTDEYPVEGPIYNVNLPYQQGQLELTPYSEDRGGEPTLNWEEYSLPEEIGKITVEVNKNTLECLKSSKTGQIGYRASGESNVPSVNKIHLVKTIRPENLPVIDSIESSNEFREEFELSRDSGTTYSRDRQYQELLRTHKMAKETLEHKIESLREAKD